MNWPRDSSKMAKKTLNWSFSNPTTSFESSNASASIYVYVTCYYYHIWKYFLWILSVLLHFWYSSALLKYQCFFEFPNSDYKIEPHSFLRLRSEFNTTKLGNLLHQNKDYLSILDKKLWIAVADYFFSVWSFHIKQFNSSLRRHAYIITLSVNILKIIRRIIWCKYYVITEDIDAANG